MGKLFEPSKPEHLDFLALDGCRRGRGSPEERAHLEGCSACRAHLVKLEELALGLRGALPDPGSVPAEFDRALLALAAREVSESIRARRFRRLAAKAAAAAAIIVTAALGLWLLEREGSSPLARRGNRGPEGMERLDIVDAYRLSLLIRDRGERAPRLDVTRWDVNRDGAVDEGDVLAIAQSSVALERGGGR